MKIQIKILDKKFYLDKSLPSYSTPGSAAMDIVCTKDVCINPQERVKIRTGIAFHIGSYNPSNSFAGMILPRSGLGTRGLVLANTVGLIDPDYQGELLVNAWNSNPFVSDSRGESIDLKAGDRFAQLLIIPIEKLNWVLVEEFSSKTTRGGNAFGSTGS